MEYRFIEHVAGNAAFFNRKHQKRLKPKCRQALDENAQYQVGTKINQNHRIECGNKQLVGKFLCKQHAQTETKNKKGNRKIDGQENEHSPGGHVFPEGGRTGKLPPGKKGKISFHFFE